jgi:hypothetical protein
MDSKTLLALYLVLVGANAFLGIAIVGTIAAVVAIVAGVMMFMGK